MRSPYQPHQKIDHYEILRRLPDRQGCQHYLAQDWRQYQQVILKFPNDATVGGRAVFERFEQEAKRSTTLKHPLFQHTLNQGEMRQEHYLVLEDLPGTTLRDHLYQAGSLRLEMGEVLRIMTAVGSALASLHAQGIVHRDLKPEHILLLETGAVRLTGLGLAEQLGTVHRDFRQVGFPVGTPDYLAPELWWGNPGSIRSDIYAVGIILYELLCGHPPFGHTTSYPLLVPQLSYDPPDLLQASPTLPPALASVVMHAIRRDPARRYTSMQELLTDLSHLDQISFAPYVLDPPSWGGKYKLLLFIIFLVLMVMGGLIAFGMMAQVIHQAAT